MCLLLVPLLLVGFWMLVNIANLQVTTEEVGDGSIIASPIKTIP